MATPTDDPVYMDLHAKYVSNILYDFETRVSTKLFRVAAIQFVRSYSASRCSCWEATCEPVFRDSSTGRFHVPAEVKVPGSQVTLTHALQGYCVAEYQHGIDADPTYLPWLDQYISYFKSSILPMYSLEDQPSSQDLPTSKALPAKRRSQPRRR
jgi:hypothetical protein